MEKLKPCPFCGRIPELTHRTSKPIGAEIEIEWSIRCPFCFCQRTRIGRYNVGNDGKLYLAEVNVADARSEVIKAWNRRANEKWVDAVRKAPTAYDPNKVVEQLEEERENVGFVKATTEASAYIRGINDAIKIVKDGGIGVL